MQFVLILIFSHIDSSSVLSIQLSPTPSHHKLQDNRDSSSAFVQDGRHILIVLVGFIVCLI